MIWKVGIVNRIPACAKSCSPRSILGSIFGSLLQEFCGGDSVRPVFRSISGIENHPNVIKYLKFHLLADRYISGLLQVRKLFSLDFEVIFDLLQVQLFLRQGGFQAHFFVRNAIIRTLKTFVFRLEELVLLTQSQVLRVQDVILILTGS